MRPDTHTPRPQGWPTGATAAHAPEAHHPAPPHLRGEAHLGPRAQDQVHVAKASLPLATAVPATTPAPPRTVQKARAPAHLTGRAQKDAYSRAFAARIAAHISAATLSADDLVPEETLRHDPSHGAKVRAAFRASVVDFGGELYARTLHLARGAFGKFHVALSDRGELVGMKTLRTVAKDAGKGALTRTSTMESIVREASLMQKYVHADVELGFDVGTQKALLKMPLAIGTLGAFVGEGPTAGGAHPLARSALRQLAGQLAGMHADDVVHQDVKSANVLVFADGRIRAGDMGEAAPAHEVKAPCTLPFAAPELLVADEDAPPADARVDVWSLGLTVLDLLRPLKHLLPLGAHADEAFVDMIFLHQDIAALRDEVVSGGRVDREALAERADATPVAAYFHAAFARDPALAEVILVHALAPPEARVGAARLAQLAADLQPQSAAGERDVVALCAQRGAGPHQRALRAALSLRLADERQASWPPAPATPSPEETPLSPRSPSPGQSAEMSEDEAPRPEVA